VQLIEAIRQVFNGRLIFPRSAQRWLTSRRGDVPGKTSTPGSDLSPREWDVLTHASRGATNTEIALQLSVSENTVRFHLKNIYAKINVTNRTEAAGWFFENGGKKP
jgi:DNA-binding NarL/FixJ family response regulator